MPIQLPQQLLRGSLIEGCAGLERCVVGVVGVLWLDIDWSISLAVENLIVLSVESWVVLIVQSLLLRAVESLMVSVVDDPGILVRGRHCAGIAR